MAGMEQLMQYVWHHRLWTSPDMTTVDGTHIQIIDPGRINTCSGPDFFNAKIRMGSQTWIGNVEIHVKASDWYRHGHDNDRAYDNVVLHVVGSSDTTVTRIDGETIPQIELRCSPDLNKYYKQLTSSAPYGPACTEILKGLPAIYTRSWLDALARERLQVKCTRIENYRQRFQGDWRQAAFIAVARALGAGINSEMFERTAIATPVKALSRHSDNLQALEAMLFGVSGMLSHAPASSGYLRTLENDFSFYSKKFNLHQPQGMNWRIGTRPTAFPYRRMAYLALLMHDSRNLIDRIADAATESNPVEALQRILDSKLKGYWLRHYSFSDNEADTNPNVGNTAIANIMINAVVPILYLYGNSTSHPMLADTALDILDNLKPESNSIVKSFANEGISCKNAADSQAIIQLKKEYCDQRKCLYCRFGHRLLASKNIVT